MFSRAPIAVLFSLSFLAIHCDAQSYSSGTDVDNSRLAGMIVSPDGKPAAGIHVELDEASSAVPVTSTYTNRDGTFELYNIPAGNYELVAESENASASNSIVVQSGQPSLQLKLAPVVPPPTEPAPVISVAQMLIPPSAQRLYDKAQMAYRKGKADKALGLVEEALQIEPQYADALTLRGVIELSNNQFDMAQQDLEHAIQVDPNHGGAYITLGAVYNHQGRFDEALLVSRRSLALQPKAWQAYFEMAKASIAKGMYAQGLQLAHQAQRLSGDSFAAVHLVKAYALVPMRLYKSAHYELQAFLKHAPNSSNSKQAEMLMAQVEAAMPANSAAVH
jgi:tetratricopeptide (TPR) repeat protein